MLALWWAVITFRHAEFTGSPARLRFSYLVSLYFLLPGLVSLASLLSGTGPLWRVAFAATGVAGVLAIGVAVLHHDRVGLGGGLVRWAWLGIPLFAIVTLIAVAPDIARSGLGAEPLQVEGFLLVGLLFVGSQLAWVMFTAPRSEDRETTA